VLFWIWHTVAALTATLTGSKTARPQ